MGPAEESRPRQRIGLICEDAASAAVVVRSLRGSWDVARVVDPPLEVLSKLDALILWFGDPPERAVRFLATCLKQLPRLPILGLTKFDTDHVVDLMKCGLGDHMTPPVDADLLRRKLERLLSKQVAPVIDTPVFRSLRPAAPQNTGMTKRACARAHVSPVFPATATVILPSGAGPKIEVRDIAIHTGDQPGGISLVADPTVAAKMNIGAWTPSTKVPLHLNFPIAISKHPIWVRARVVRVVAPTPDEPDYTIAFQYWLDRPREEPLVQKFWVRSQQLELLKKRGDG